MNVNKRLRLNILGYVQALLFSAMLLIFINGEAGWGMIYIYFFHMTYLIFYLYPDVVFNFFQ